MKLKKKMIVTLTLSIIFTALVFARGMNITKVEAQEVPVKLYYSQYGGINNEEDIYIAVKNLGYEKKVLVNYTIDDGKKQTKSALYVKKNSDGYELWRCTISPKDASVHKYKFSLSYEVDGKVYLDNNNGKNYVGTQLNCSVAVSRVLKENGKNGISGRALVKNLGQYTGNNKSVKVRYTTDNWATYKEIKANYIVGVGNDLAIWYFYIPTINSVDNKNIQFATCYKSDGKLYWDNNFEMNYLGKNEFFNSYINDLWNI